MTLDKTQNSESVLPSRSAVHKLLCRINDHRDVTGTVLVVGLHDEVLVVWLLIRSSGHRSHAS